MSNSNKISMSRQWNRLVNIQFSEISEDFLESFRLPSESNKFVAWNPYEKSTRYFKFLLYKVASSMTDSMLEDYKRLSTITDISLGGPLEIIFDGMKINADYYAAVEEYDFLERNNIFECVDKIVEIGGGVRENMSYNYDFEQYR